MCSNENTVIGFIGTGVMGQSMAQNILKSGYRLNVYNRTKASAAKLIEAGAVWKSTIAELASESNVIITIVGYPKDVEEVYLGAEGIVRNAKPGSYLIDMTTSKPSLAKTIYEQAREKGMFALDAPVSGGDIGAREGKLVIMIGGEEKVLQDVYPILTSMGKQVVLQGGPGAGQYTKMCNQILVAGNMVGISEAMGYARKAGLDPIRVLKLVENGAAGSWLLSNTGPKMIEENYAPGFYVKHFIKDLSIALESAQEMGMNVPGVELAKSLYEKLAGLGEENSGTQALAKLYL
ncbi:MAG: NAD(P)-dependent oxidoreductase [Desulfitobacterium hafniense]|nr:NAD(P)-dependent oxidoreductase [Desulfitobacterium hafniense]